MLLPLIILSIGAVFAGFVFTHAFVSEGTGEFWKGSLVFNEELLHHMHHVPVWVKWAPFTVMVLGFAGAYVAYIASPGVPAAFVAAVRPLHTFFYNKWYFDELYDFLFVRPAFALGRLFWKIGDIGLIDRFGPNGAAWVVAQGAGQARKIQSGLLTSYALWMLLGLVAAVSWVLVR